MKKTICTLMILLILMVSGCGLMQQKPKTLHVIKSSVYIDGYSDYEIETKYYHDEVMERADGLYEVKGRAVSDGATSDMRWFFTSDGMPIGNRSYDNNYGSYDTLVIDFMLEDYIASLEDFDYLEDDTIYYEDGSYEEVEVEDGIIIEAKIYSEDGQLRASYEFDEYGSLTKMELYDGDYMYYSVKNKYKDVDIK